ncbi:MAG: metallophosphoesterase family protein, partial [Eubacteriales bacterium]
TIGGTTYEVADKSARESISQLSEDIANIPSGKDGDDGKDGVGIESVVQTTTSTEDGGTNVVTVTNTNGTSFTFSVKNGSKGSTGEKGEKGDNGDKGETGATGAAGADGKSAYAYAVEGGYTGTEEEFAAKLADAANVGVDSIPEYIQTAAAAVAKTVNRRQTEKSVCFAFMTDAHLGYYTDLENAAGKHAGQALKAINNRCLLDFVVHGGDYTTGAWNTTVDATFEDMEDYLELIGSVTDVPQVWCIGNHDDAPYQATADRLSQAQSFAAVGRKNRVSNAACNPGCNYGYLDLDSQKVRIIYLDTHDKRDWGTVAVGAGETAPDFLYADNIGGAQLQFLVNEALDFSAKADPSAWGVIAVSHAVLNGSGTCTDAVSGESHDTNTANAALILSAYQNGGSGSVTNNGVTAEYDFSALESRAAVICCVHGNDHKYADEIVGNGILSICCPNICNGRERESADGNTYTKTEGTAEGTSFCIITVDRVNQKIYADHYGAGIDREYAYTISAPVGYTNQIPISTDTDGSIYNGVGYKSGYRLGSSGTESSMDGMYVTGFIPCKTGDIIRLQNLTFQYGASNASNQRISIYDSAKNHIAQANATSIKANCDAINDENGVYTQFTIKSFSGFDTTTAAYFRLNGTYIGDDSVITVNEEIV